MNYGSYERGLDDLKLVCDAYIEDLRRKLPCDIIGNYVHQYNEKNNNGEITLEEEYRGRVNNLSDIR